MTFPSFPFLARLSLCPGNVLSGFGLLVLAVGSLAYFALHLPAQAALDDDTGSLIRRKGAQDGVQERKSLKLPPKNQDNTFRSPAPSSEESGDSASTSEPTTPPPSLFPPPGYLD